MELIVTAVSIGLIWGSMKVERMIRPDEPWWSERNFAVATVQIILVSAALIIYGGYIKW